MQENNFDFENLGSTLKHLRLTRDLTQDDIAKALHVTPGYVSNVENGRTGTSIKVLCKYAECVGITLDELVGRVIPEYREAALEHGFQKELSRLSEEQKEKLLATLEVWMA